MERRLAAILAADVAGYSKLMSEDEARTLSTLRQLRRNVLAPAVEDHRGHVIKSMGDGWLIDFPSSGDAVACAIQLQEALKDHGSIRLRMGLHVGDVTFEDDDIYGDGVNVAARLEGLAEPGAIVISDVARRTLDGKVAAEFNELGRLPLKNIAVPVLAYGRGMKTVARSGSKADGSATAEKEKPSLAVMPFEIMSDDPDQAFFANGIVEDIITNLSKVAGLTIIARSSTSHLRSQTRDVRELGQILVVRYVLQGSIRKVANRLRLSAHLVDCRTGNPLWAERYDRVVDDIFDLQDEIVREIVTALRIKLSDGEFASLMNRGTNDIDAWGLLCEAYEIIHRFDFDSMLKARNLAKRACDIDPGYALAWSVLGLTYWYEARIGSVASHDENLGKSLSHLERAMSIDPDHPEIAGFYASALTMTGRYQEAVDCCKRNLENNPGSASSRAYLANAYHWRGDHEQAVRLYDEAKRLNPLHPVWYYPMSARAVDASGDQEEAERILRAGLTRQPDNFPCLLHLASILGRRGEKEEAKEILSQALLLSPEFKIQQVDQWLMMDDDAYTKTFIAGLLQAGLSE